MISKKTLSILLGLSLLFAKRSDILVADTLELRGNLTTVPELSAFSATHFAIYRGDILTLEVETQASSAGGDVKYNWVRGESTECSLPRCEFNTKTWDIGTQRIFVTISNDYGHQYLQYEINVLQLPSATKPRRIQPKKINAERARRYRQPVAYDDFQAQSLSGVGYSHSRGKTVVIDRNPLFLAWSERIRVPRDGKIVFGVPSREESILLAKSSVRLMSENRDRRIQQISGTVRYRQLSNTAPRWRVEVGSWLVLSPSVTSDFIVSVVQPLGLQRGEGSMNLSIPINRRDASMKARGTDAGRIYSLEGASSARLSVEITVLRGSLLVSTGRKFKKNNILGAKLVSETTRIPQVVGIDVNFGVRTRSHQIAESARVDGHPEFFLGQGMQIGLLSPESNDVEMSESRNIGGQGRIGGHPPRDLEGGQPSDVSSAMAVKGFQSSFEFRSAFRFGDTHHYFALGDGDGGKKNLGIVFVEVRKPSPTRISRLIRATTPGFLWPFEERTGFASSGGGNFKQGRVLPGEEFDSIEMAVKSGVAAMDRRDAVRALASAATFSEKAPEDFDLSLLLARSSKDLFLEEQAKTFFEMAISLRPEASAPYFEAGEMYLKSGDFDAAADSFQMAAQNSYSDVQALYHDFGLAEYGRGNLISATQKFTYSLWEAKESSDARLADASRDYISRIHEDEILLFEAGIGVFFDSNIFRLDEKSQDFEEVDALPRSAQGRTVSASARMVFFESWKKSWNLDLKTRADLYTELALVGFSTVRQNAFSSFRYRFGGELRDDAVFELKVRPSIDLVSFGGKAAWMNVGVKTSVGIPGIFLKPAIQYKAAFRSDLDAQQAVEIDPTIWQLVNHGDGSNRFGGSGVSIEPWSDDGLSLNTAVFFGVTRYLDVASKASSYIDTIYVAKVAFSKNSRTAYHLEVGSASKTFYADDDVRRDQSLSVSLDWKWFFTPNFSHFLSMQYQNNRSSILAHSFQQIAMVSELSLSL